MDILESKEISILEYKELVDTNYLIHLTFKSKETNQYITCTCGNKVFYSLSRKFSSCLRCEKLINTPLDNITITVLPIFLV